jgi:alpha-beta hydrolase superfamily lysophospholipase
MLSIAIAGALWVTASALPGRLPIPTGPFDLGTEVVYITRAMLSGPRRRISVQVWFPAKLPKSSPNARYLPSSSLVTAMKKDEYMNIKPEVLDGWNKLRSHGWMWAPIAPGKFPVVLFSPGFGLSRASYTTIVEELASHGNIVLAIDHPYMGLTIWRDGKAISTEDNPNKGKPDANVSLMAADDSAILDMLFSSSSPLSKFRAYADSSRVAVVGHSIGGAASMEAARTDRRILAAVNYDGSAFGPVASLGLAKPFLVLLNEPDANHRPPKKLAAERLKEWTDLIAKHATPSYLAFVDGTIHLTFTDLPFLVPKELMTKNGAAMPPRQSWEVITKTTRAFLEDVWSRSKGERLAKAVKALPKVRLQRFND